MKCEDASDILQRPTMAEPERRVVEEHLSGCASCRDAALALAVLRADAQLAVPAPSAQAFKRAIALTAARAAWTTRTLPRRTSFLAGAGIGAALAASLTAVAMFVIRPEAPLPSARAPSVLMSLHESRDISVALSSPEPLMNAEITVALSGDIGLRGFADRRELQWTTDLDRGVNQLTLPIVALGKGGGQVLVEVQHGEKRRTFVVDVRTADDSPIAERFVPGVSLARDASVDRSWISTRVVTPNTEKLRSIV